jgi:hypothetical protein
MIISERITTEDDHPAMWEALERHVLPADRRGRPRRYNRGPVCGLLVARLPPPPKAMRCTQMSFATSAGRPAAPHRAEGSPARRKGHTVERRGVSGNSTQQMWFEEAGRAPNASYSRKPCCVLGSDVPSGSGPSSCNSPLQASPNPHCLQPIAAGSYSAFSTAGFELRGTQLSLLSPASRHFQTVPGMSLPLGSTLLLVSFEPADSQLTWGHCELVPSCRAVGSRAPAAVLLHLYRPSIRPGGRSHGCQNTGPRSSASARQRQLRTFGPQC